MKRFYISLLLLSLTSIGFSQTYTPFLAESKIWIENYYADYTTEGWECDSPPGQNNECLTRYYVLNGDTMLDGNSYKIMWRRIRDNNPYAANNEYGLLYPYAFLRENLDSQRVLMHENSLYFNEYCDGSLALTNNHEYKIYDFLLNKNDTVKTCNVTHIINKKYHQTLLNGDTLVDFDNLFMEGIGSFNGPLTELYNPEYAGSNLQCVYLNGVAIYGSCSPQLLNVKHNSNETSELKIYLNQIEDNLTIISGVNQTVNIYDLLGNVVYSELITRGETIIDLSFLTPQLYIVKGNAVSKKIVKL
jgi:hypothetical protein